jgi:hypothetical protein
VQPRGESYIANSDTATNPVGIGVIQDWRGGGNHYLLGFYDAILKIGQRMETVETTTARRAILLRQPLPAAPSSRRLHRRRGTVMADERATTASSGLPGGFAGARQAA